MRGFAVLVLSLYLAVLSDAASIDSNMFGSRQTKGQVNNTHEDYVTGMVASRKLSGIMWMVTSYDDENFLWGVNIDSGLEVAWVNITGAANHDWEDLAYGPCADDCRTKGCEENIDRYCIYIGDIGSHSGDGAVGNVYMVREPTDITPQDGSVYRAEISVVDKLTFSWSEPDAETLMVSPQGKLYVLSKVFLGRGMLAQIPDSAWGNVVVLDMADTALLKVDTGHYDPQGGSISPDGHEMVVVGEEDVFYYSISDGDYIKAVRTQIPQRVASYVSEKNVEAIAWSPDASGFYTLAKGSDNFIYYYPKAPVVG